ncbi:hypothetical protein CCACVL1_21065 [Corchorus capsularis]|uniref:Saposin B-type domain-containing protein n=1 Tax=Corchorus capsularis TaxID=210143 RepID=A0A1R3H8E9_COCAP|nr:hypothetical protein CCACVL1_21065 [Corchorus capsularis]
MASSKASASIAFLLALNLLFSTLVIGYYDICQPLFPNSELDERLLSPRFTSLLTVLSVDDLIKLENPLSDSCCEFFINYESDRGLSRDEKNYHLCENLVTFIIDILPESLVSNNFELDAMVDRLNSYCGTNITGCHY